MAELILGIESSCDETGLAWYERGVGLRGEVLFSQTAIHAPYGGVVPELAARDHVRRLPLLFRELQHQTGIQRGDAVAVTSGPGLIAALLVGVQFAKSLALAWGVPWVPVHHLEGHLLAPLLSGELPLPSVALLVSGGHSQLLAMEAIGHYRIIGDTLDDAAGEAFDKVAKIMGLSYPGGPALAALAEQGDPQRFTLPRPMLDRPGLDFSFSGLKTACRLQWERIQDGGSPQDQADLAAAFEWALVETLVEKARRALKETGYQNLVVAGGVSANRRLRTHLGQVLGQTAAIHYPKLAHCTDNAAMIALAASFHLDAGQSPLAPYAARARWSLEEYAP